MKEQFDSDELRLLSLEASSFLQSRNPCSASDRLLAFFLSLNGFGMNWLSGTFPDRNIPEEISNHIVDAAISHPDCDVIRFIGRILRCEVYPTSWLNTEKQLFRHRLVDCFARILQSSPLRNEVVSAAFLELLQTVETTAPTVTVDCRGQCVDVLAEFSDLIPSNILDPHIELLAAGLGSYLVAKEKDEILQFMDTHDTIDPHIDFPERSTLEILWEAANSKAKERSFVFCRRLLRELHSRREDLKREIEQLLISTEPQETLLAQLRNGVLCAPPLSNFISRRLPSYSSALEDYIVNRHQVLVYDLTIQDLCRLLIAAPENGSSERRARSVINSFFRQAFAIGQASNVGLDARPFFIDHGRGALGYKLDWPSYVFIPAGSIWGKGAGVDLSCGVAFGGGVDLDARCGRDGSYIGGSWSATLYHGHSHIGGESGSLGAESRDRILHFGLTVEDGKRLPWGKYIEAEDHLNGDVYPGVRTYLLSPKGKS